MLGGAHPHGSQALTVVVQGLVYITAGGAGWAAGRRHQSQMRHPHAPLNTNATIVKSINFFIFHFSHRNGIVSGATVAKETLHQGI
jgi:hypothetical protein